MLVKKISFFMLFIANLASAQQVKLSKSILANGGNTSGNQIYRISSTVGQSLIDTMSGAGLLISSGFWHADIDLATSVKQKAETVPIVFQLNQNYPNPFNPATNISFSIAKPARVNLTLYDLLGRKVLTMLDELKQPGEYKFTFDAAELASGIYFYRLSAIDNDNESHIFTKKMIILK